MTKTAGLVLSSLSILIANAPCLAAATDPASDASIEEYLQVSNAQQLLDRMKQQVGGVIKNSMQQASQRAAQAKPITPERQAALDHMAEQMSDVVAETLNWNSLRPMYMRIYHDSFTQSEIDGIIEFYKTPAGKALINKLPLVMQNVMNEMQVYLRPMQQKIAQIQHDTLEQLKAMPDK